jgi:chromosome partitioning protein
MKTVVVHNPKGGSGKSTLTVHLADAADHAGDGPIIISDADPQGTASDWFNQRMKAKVTTPRYAELSLANCREKVRDLDAAGASYLFIDTTPSRAEEGSVNAALLALADLILIPLNPTAADLRSLVKGLPLIKKSGKPFHFMLARVRTNLKNNDGTAAALEALGLVLPTRMHERVVYSDTFAHGRTALETEPKGLAAQEVAALWADLKDRLKS